MAIGNPYGSNYGRADRGQMSPFRDTARRRQPFEEEDEQMQQMQQMPSPEPAPPPLAQAVAPRQSFNTYTGGAGAGQQDSPLAQAVRPQVQRQQRSVLPMGSASSPYAQQPRPGTFDSVVGEERAPSGIGRNAGSYRTQQIASAAEGTAEDALGTPPPAGRMGVMGVPGLTPEQELSARQAVSALGVPTSLDGGGGTATQQPGGGYNLSNVGGTGASNYAYGGFDFGQSAANRDTGKSAKYAFADLSRQASEAGAPMPTTKQGAEEWFNTYIAPGMQKLGYTINWVQGDKAEISGWQGTGTVDFLQNADGSNPMLAWQVEGEGAPIDPLATAIGGGAADPAAQELAKMLGIDTSNPLWKQILDQLIADQSGQSEIQAFKDLGAQNPPQFPTTRV